MAYPNPPALAAAVPSPNTLPPVEPRGLEKVGAEPNAGTPPNPGDPPKVGGLPNTGAAPKPPEQNRGKKGTRISSKQQCRKKEEKLDFQVDNLYNRAVHLVTWHGIIFKSNCHRASKLQDNLLRKSGIRKVPNTCKELQPN